MLKPFRLLAAAALASGLVGCGGGGSGGPSAPGGGSSGAGGPSGSSSSSFNQGAEGVTVGVSRAVGADAVFTVSKGGAGWNTDDSGNNVHIDTSWKGASRVDDSTAPTKRIAAYTNIGAPATATDPQDPDYLLLGYWNGLVGQRRVTPFYWGSMPYAGALPTTGTVAYSGPAAGRYNGAGNTHHGHFLARAKLTANFSTGTLSGTVSNFQIQRTYSSSAPLGDDTWSVTLNSIALTGANFMGTTTGGGAWSGRFFGPAGANPTGVAGVFDATTTSSTSLKFDLDGSFAAD